MPSAIELAMKLVGGKWKCLILYHLGGGRSVRRSAAARGIPPERGGQNLSARALYTVRLGQGIRPAPRNGNQPLPAARRLRQLKLRQPETEAA